MHKCKCLYCSLDFDRDREPYVKVTERRYAHKACADKSIPQMTQNELDYDKLVNYIKKTLGSHYIAPLVAKQIKEFRQDYNFTYSGMLGSLTYWYEVKGANPEDSNGGIGILPYIYQQAREYYDKMAAAALINLQFKDYKPKIIELTIAPPHPEERPVKLFNLEEGN